MTVVVQLLLSQLFTGFQGTFQLILDMSVVFLFIVSNINMLVTLKVLL